MERARRRKLSDRFGGAQAFFCNSGAEAIEAALKWARKATGRSEARRARGLVPRPHDRRALGHRASRRSARAFEPLVPGARFATPETLADARRPATRPRSCSSPCRARAACIRSRPRRSPRRARSPTSTARCSILDEVQTGVGRTRRVLRLADATASGPTRSRSRRGSRTACRSARCSSPTTRRPASCPATTPRPSAATRSRAPRPARSSTRSTTTLLAHVRDDRRALREAALRRACAAPACCSRSSSTGPAAPGRRTPRSSTACSSARAGETALRLTPPLTISSATRPTSAIELLQEVLA